MGQSPEDLGLRPDLSRLPSEMRGLIRHGYRGEHASCSDAIVEVCAAMFQADFNVGEIWNVLTDPANGISDSFFSKVGELGEAYLERIISQAHDLTIGKELSTTMPKGSYRGPSGRQRNRDRGQREEKGMEEKNFMKDLCGVYGIAVHELTEEELEQYTEKPVRAFLLRDHLGLTEADDERSLHKQLPPRQNPHEGSRRFFEKLPAHYKLHPGEQVELAWNHRGEGLLTGKECFPDLEQASARAVSLGPSYNIAVQVVVEPGSSPEDTGSTQLLARWRYDAFEKHAPPDVVSLQPLVSAEPSLVWCEYFFDVDVLITCEARWYYYRSRCPIRAQIEESRKRRQDDGAAEGENSSTPLDKLTEHGWFRNRNLITGSAKPAMDNATMDEDPVAQLIRSVVIFDGAGFYGAYPKAGTAEAVLNAGGEEGWRPVGWPSSPREMHERLVRIAPTLQTKNLITDLKLVDYYAHTPGYSTSDGAHREGYIHVEHWRKDGAAEEEGIWVFMAVEPGCRAPEEAIEETVWSKVKALQGST